ncbi:hypothetical protein DEO48_24750 [Enterobacter sp. CGMCC 5087]|uniref:hypothetical protein n=1 Tax=Enterobacter sp. CGMCC 5087 TaxID=2183878 RepID=UPI000D6798E2|nr:hypothetical protein [Enterobacter sp. CGMCC 5087]PWI77367.1 hypothetical protein DEO48_24750 [Enterobacter sp. CGMCC 5087]
MKLNNLFLGFALLTFTGTAFADKDNPQFSDYPVVVSKGPFAKKIALSTEQQNYTDKWKQTMQRELVKPVNFAGHYRLYLSWNGELPKECGDKRWVCGWVIDKISGETVSELPEFNGNKAYFSYHANGTPVPVDFMPEFYPESSMIWIEGSNIPPTGKINNKCENIAYTFNDSKFITVLDAGKCEVDYGDDPNAPRQ